MSAIQYEGLDNGCYLFIEDIDNLREYLGIDSDERLAGKWLVVWRKKDSDYPAKYYDPLRFPKRGGSTQEIAPDKVYDVDGEFILFYKLDDDKDCVKAVRAVNFFVWNRLDSSNYAEVARQIHHTDVFTYKYAEIIFRKDCFAWGACLLHDLPHEQAQELIDYCLDYYKDWNRL